MRTFLYLLFFVFIGSKSFSQANYFLYIQSEDRLPFYVKLGEKIFSSTATGYLIIGKMEDTRYEINLGFPKSIHPEQKFQVAINKRDKGFELKQLPEKGWALVNLQNQAVIISNATSGNADLIGEKKTDAFSVMLSRVVNDSAILYTANKPTVVQTAAVKKTTPEKTTTTVEAPVVTTPEVAIKEEQPADVTATPQPDTTDVNFKIKETTTTYAPPKNDNVVTTAKTPAVDKAFITRIKEQQEAGTYKATYLAQYNYRTDTIDILIPADAVVATKQKEEPVIKQNAPLIAEAKKTTARTDTSAVVIQLGSVTDTFKVKQKIIMINSDCRNFASENDVDKIRVRILGEKNIDDKLAAARKYYRSKCFTVQQIRALTELFATDELKYRFLDLSYAFASDSGNYYLLEEVITEDYYKKRFQAMVRK